VHFAIWVGSAVVFLIQVVSLRPSSLYNSSRDKLKLPFCNSKHALRAVFSRAGRSARMLALFAGATSTTIFNGPVEADPAPVPANFNQTTAGAVSTTVPNGTCGVVATATGGGGASHGLGAGGRGAAGAVISATFKVLPQLAVVGTVASGGVVSAVVGGTSFGGTGTAAGGNGGTIVAPSGNQHRGGGGGGSSAFSVGGVKLIEAGGGGGGGAAHQASPVGNGGNGGFTGIGAGVAAPGNNGFAGFQTTGTVGAGAGGLVAAGGAGGVNSSNATFNGFIGQGVGTGTGGNGGPDDAIDSGGGGGGGYTGGGGGASTTGVNQTGGGGGGGASFVAATSPTVAGSTPTSITGVAGVPASAAITTGPDGALSFNWVPCLYTLTVSKTASPSPVNAGAKTTWTVAVTNTGPDPMTAGDTLTLTDTLPPGPIGSVAPTFKVTSMSTSGGVNADMASGAMTCTGVTVGSTMPGSTTCTRPYSAPSAPGAPSGGTRGLNAGETLTITYEQVFANTAACTSVTNQATVVDRTSAGSTTTRSVSTLLNVNCYDLAVVKDVSPTVAGAGQLLTWTITVNNIGPGSMNGPDETAANPLIVTDVAPTTNVSAPVAFTSSGPAGACTYTSPTITCPTGLGAGQSQVFTFQQTVNGSAPSGAVITNTASVTDFKTGDTNDSDPASVTLQSNLTLRKVVQNDNGGTNTLADFTLAAAGPTPTSGVSGTAPVTNFPVNAGTYLLSESGAAVANYTFLNWVCTGAGTFTAPNQIVLAAGQSATCTATNNDKPRLTLDKSVINDNGGAALNTAFTLTAAGPTPLSGIRATPAVTNVAVIAGSYTLGESGPAGYTGVWNCPGFTLSGAGLNVLALAQNQNATCTITNNDIGPLLTLVKTMTNNNGGNELPAAFTLSTLTGPTLISGATGTPTVTNAPVNVGTFTLGETGPAGYVGTWTCAGTGTFTAPNTIALALNQTASCTINNDDVAPTVRVRKTSNGGVGTFSFTGTNGYGSDSIITVTAGTQVAGVVKPVTANVITDLTETATAGFFLAGAPTCTGLGIGTVTLLSGTTYRLSANALKPGATVVCDFVNTKGVPSISLTKTPTPGSVNTAGQSISYAIVVSNSGNVPVTGITVTDPLGTVICATSGNATIVTLTVSGTENCTLTYAATQVNFDNNGGGDGDIDNTVSATGTYNAGAVTNNASATVVLNRNPLLTIAKTAIFAPGEDLNGNGMADLGDKITYRYVVANAGNLTINGVDVLDFLRNSNGPFTDPKSEMLTDVAPLGDSTDATANDGIWSVLAPGDSVRFTTVYTVTQQDVDLLP
jgi:uncharacterized repeat protein (TIGR01451 family)